MVCKLSEEAGVWKSEGRNITNYSARHYYATQSLMRKLDIYEVALNMGTSVYYLEQTYSHITTIMKSDELTKGQGYYKHKEEQEEKRKVAKNAIEDALGKDKPGSKYKSF